MPETRLEITLRGELDEAVRAAVASGSFGSGEDLAMAALRDWRAKPAAPAEGTRIAPRPRLDDAAEASLSAELEKDKYRAVAALNLCDAQRALPGRLHLEGAEIDDADYRQYEWLQKEDEQKSRRCKFVRLGRQDLDRDLSKSQARRGRDDYVALDLMGCKAHRGYEISEPGGKETEADVNLVGSDLRQANLKWTNLWGANLSGAELYQASLQGAMLARTQFGHADVAAAEFRDADLGAADLSGVSGLAADKLAGAKLTSARLPEAVAKFDRLAHANKGVQSANTNLIVLIGACLYCWIMIARTQDIDLISSAAGVPLPVVGTSIPLNQFYVVAPLIVLSIYVYLHYYLQSIWTDIANLPAIFPDGEAVNEKIDPWLLGVVPCKHVYRLRMRRKLSADEGGRRHETAIYWLTAGIAWVLAPMTILAMWVRFLPAHRPAAWALLSLFVVSLAIMAYSAWLADATMWDGRSGYRKDRCRKDYDSKTGLERKYLMRPGFDRIRGGMAAAVGLLALAVAVVIWQSFLPASERLADPGWPRLDADLAGADLTGANLAGADLTGANLTKARLAGADLSTARLAGARLDGACGDAATRLPPDFSASLPACPSAQPAPPSP